MKALRRSGIRKIAIRNLPSMTALAPLIYIAPIGYTLVYHIKGH
jgi:hypothetical protein